MWYFTYHSLEIYGLKTIICIIFCKKYIIFHKNINFPLRWIRDRSPIKLSSNLDLDLHIEIVCCKALRVLGILMRLSKDIKFTSSLKVLYCSLIQPILEYGAIIWDPHTAENLARLKEYSVGF